MKPQTEPKPASAHTPGVFEIMAQWKSHEIQHWLDTTQSNVARALFESAAKIEAERRDLLAACEAIAPAIRNALCETDPSGTVSVAECLDASGRNTFTVTLTLSQANALADAVIRAGGLT